MAWSWRHLDAAGGELPVEEARDFPTQGDAETWLGEHWRTLAADGVAAVELLEDGRSEYTMSLTATGG
jgi:hypothetical protein